ncbi:hypothetical protein BA78_4453 [Aspergillus fumigatus]|nr:hypothetical protein BA78_4453 [Aspergillus fumigatus]
MYACHLQICASINRPLSGRSRTPRPPAPSVRQDLRQSTDFSTDSSTSQSTRLWLWRWVLGSRCGYAISRLQGEYGRNQRVAHTEADKFGVRKVIGLDISPHKNPDDMPENLSLQVDDLNCRFTFPSNHFDLVHSSLLATGINRARWPSYLADIRRCALFLKPGGWVQLIEIYFNVQSDNGSITEEHALRRWSRHFMRSYEGTKDLRVGTRLNTLLRDGGFEEIDARMIPLPLSAWSSDPRMQQIGMLNRENVNNLLPSLALYPLTQISGMSQQDFQDLITQARREAETASLKAYFPL